MALTQVAAGLLAGSITSSQITSVAASTLTGTQTIPRGTLPTGSVLQVVNATTIASIATSSTSFVTTGFSVSITPSSSSNKILLFVNGGGGHTGGAGVSLWATIYRNNATNLGDASYGLERIYCGTSGTNIITPHSMSILDSPATTSSITYTCYFRSSSGTVDFSLSDRGVISFTAQEISA